MGTRQGELAVFFAIFRDIVETFGKVAKEMEGYICTPWIPIPLYYNILYIILGCELHPKT